MNARLMKFALASALFACSIIISAARVYAQGAEAPLTNTAVVKLVRAGFSEKTVVAIIRTRPARFDLSPDRLIELKKSGVSEKVILAMLARQEAISVADDGWEDDSFFKDGDAAGKSSQAQRADDPGNELGIFGSSSGSRSRSQSSTGRGGSTGDTETTGSATVRIVRPPIEPGGAPPRLERSPTLTNDAVVELVEAGFSEGTIIRRIEQSPVEFDLSAPKLAELRRRRVTEPVINAMKSAMQDEPVRPEK